MSPFIFVLKVAIPKNKKTTNREFIFLDRTEAEKFRTLLKNYNAHVTELFGFTPSSCDSALRKVVDEINSP
jgi:hypothetical protein